MILVTVGTHNKGFDRLLRPMDELAALTDEPVIIQRGSSTFEPAHADSFRFASNAQMARLTREARVIVSHSAAGTVILALSRGKPIVVVPRLRRFGEVLDDHQTQLATALGDAGRAIAVLDPTVTSLREAIDLASTQQPLSLHRRMLFDALRNQLDLWGAARSSNHSPNEPCTKAASHNPK